MWFIPTTTTNPERERRCKKIHKVTCTCNLLSFPSPPHVALSLSLSLSHNFIIPKPTLADFTVIPWISSPVICPRGREEKDRDNEKYNHLLHYVVING